MWIESMTLQNYRNYDMLEAHFSPTLNIFVGQNAQGKTNFLTPELYLLKSISVIKHQLLLIMALFSPH